MSFFFSPFIQPPSHHPQNLPNPNLSFTRLCTFPTPHLGLVTSQVVNIDNYGWYNQHAVQPTVTLRDKTQCTGTESKQHATQMQLTNGHSPAHTLPAQSWRPSARPLSLTGWLFAKGIQNRNTSNPPVPPTLRTKEAQMRGRRSSVMAPVSDPKQSAALSIHTQGMRQADDDDAVTVEQN